jgi:hypothetical protein
VTSLNLSAPDATSLPASAFPTPADVYVCDKCGRDVTKHLHRGQAHVWKPVGPNRYQCRFGQKYLTGAMEWDQLGEWERKRRIGQTVGLGILCSAAFSIVGLVVYLALHRSKAALICASAIAALPFLLMNVPFWLDVAASVWRTRVGTSGSTPGF